MKNTWRTVIEISSSHLKIVRSSGRARRREVVGCRVGDIVGFSDEEIALRLKDMARAWGGLRGDQVISVIPRQDVIVRLLDLPSHDPLELRPMAELQVVQQLPYNLGEVAIDSTVLVKKGDGTSLLMAVAVPTEIFSRHWAIYQKAGIVPHQITISSVGIGGCLPFMEAVKDVCAIVDVDAQMSEVCIVEGQRLLACRQIPVGVKQLSAVGLDDLARQVELTITSYKKDNIGAAVGHIYLTSSGVRAEDIVTRSRHPLPIETLPLLQKIPMAKGMVWPGEALAGQISLASVLGLVCEERPIAFDLIPRMVREEMGQRRFWREVLRSGSFLLLGIGALALAFSLPFFEKSSQLKTLEKELKVAKAKAAIVQAKADRIEGLEGLRAQRLVVGYLLREIYGVITPEIVLTSLTIDERRSLVFQGYGAGQTAVSTFQDALGRMSFCQDVKLHFINKRIIQNAEASQFKMVCQIKGGS